MNKRAQFSIVTGIFFLWGFATCMNDILVPQLKRAFELSYFQSMLIQFAFFSTYLLISIPAGKLVRRFGYPRGMISGLLLASLGALLFLPASMTAAFPLFLGALAVLASGITILQVAANPYVAALGETHTSSVRLTLAQAFNSLGTTLAPWIGASLILSAAVVTKAQSLGAVRLPYFGLSAIFLILAVVIGISKLPEINEEQTSTLAEENTNKKSVWEFPRLTMGAVAIFAYVGGEVAVGSFMVSYLSQSNFLNWNPAHAARLLSFYWGGAMVGRFIGSYLLSKISPSRLVGIHALVICALLWVVTRKAGMVSAVAIIGIGLFNSILFPTIFTLSLEGLGRFTAEGSGILCSAIIGGAIIPPLQGWLADHIGINASFIVPIVCYLYIVTFSWLIRKQQVSNLLSYAG